MRRDKNSSVCVVLHYSHPGMIGRTTTTTTLIRRQLVGGIIRRRRRPLVAPSSFMSRRQQSQQSQSSPLHHRLLSSSSSFHFNPLAPHYLNENHHHSPRVQRLHNKFLPPRPSSTSIIRHFSSHNNNSNHDNDDDKETKQQSQQQFATIIQPPIRSRPFRSFKGARAPQTRTPPRRIPLSTRNSNSKTVSNHSNNPDTSMTTSNHNESFPMAETAATRGTYPVRAVHAAQSIDLAAVISKVFATKGVKKMIERLSVVIQLPPPPLNGGASNNHQGKQFIAIFRFGSVVFFNVSPREVARYLWLIKQQSTDPVLTGVEHKETFCVHIRPNQNYHPEQQSQSQSSSPVTGEYCIVPELNMKSVDVISNVMAQSVALDAYNDTVDELLASFASINQVVKGSGQLTTVEQTSLFRTGMFLCKVN